MKNPQYDPEDLIWHKEYLIWHKKPDFIQTIWFETKQKIVMFY